MKVKLTREELYELVWSMPMTKASKQLGISDVMLGKLCRQRNVPRPPRGYWQAQSSEKKRHKFVKASLPNLPEPSDDFYRYLLQEQVRRDQPRPDEFDPDNLSVPVPPPPEEFKESIKEFEQRLEENLPVLPEPPEIKVLHSIAKIVLDADTLLAKGRGSNTSIWGPKYQSDKGKLELHFLNCVLHWFEMMGFSVRLAGIKHLRFYASVPNHDREFRVFLIEHDPSDFARKHRNEKKRTAFGFSWEDQYSEVSAGKKYYEYSNFTSHIIKSVILDAELKKEMEFRERVFANYPETVKQRKWAIQRKAEQERLDAEKKRKALEALLANRVNLMDSAVADMQASDSIRELIQTIKKKSQKAKKEIDGLDHWIRWASHHANFTDPRHMSADGIEAWIKKFKLRD
jgi:hypothetical protein